MVDGPYPATVAVFGTERATEIHDAREAEKRERQRIVVAEFIHVVWGMTIVFDRKFVYDTLRATTNILKPPVPARGPNAEYSPKTSPKDRRKREKRQKLKLAGETTKKELEDLLAGHLEAGGDPKEFCRLLSLHLPNPG
jgi:hypothetical protein